MVFFPLSTMAQPRVDTEVWGTWKGFLKTTEKKIAYELVIGDKSGTTAAYSKIVFNNNGEVYYAIKSVLIKKEKQRYVFEEDQLLSDNLKDDAPKKIRQINTVEMNKTNNEMVLSGTFKTKPVKELRIASGDISVYKSSTPDSAGLLSELQKLGLAAGLVFDSSDPLEGTDLNNPNIFLIKKIITINTQSFSIKNPAIINTIAQSNINLNIPLPETDRFFINHHEEPIVYKFTPSLKKSLFIKSRSIKNVVVKAVSLRAKTTINKANPPAALVASKPKIQTKSTPGETIANTTNTNSATYVKSTEKPIAPIIVPPVVSKPMVSPSVIAPGSASALDKRKIETIQTIYFNGDSLKLTLYDNGEVDGDTVSVVVNGKVIMGKKGLSTNAITETLYITPELGDSLQMIMYAENLGSIGSNTGLLIVQDGKERYEIRFSGDLNKNAAVIFKRRRQ